MAIHIEKDGWKVSADTVQELETAIGVVQRALQVRSDPPKRPRGRPPGRTTDEDAIAKERAERMNGIALPFLRAIASADHGIDASGIVAALKLKSRLSLGSVAQTTNRLVQEMGFRQSDVYCWKKQRGGEKIWLPRARIREFIETAESRWEGTIK